MTTKKRKSIHYDKFNPDKLEERNRIIRERFEKEAHDREREEIMQVARGYEEWISDNTIKQLMIR